MNISNRRKQIYNRFLNITMKKNKFRVKIDAIYNNQNIRINDAIIDTGCTHSHITYSELYVFMSEQERINAKRNAIRNNRCALGYGVEAQRNKRQSLKGMSMKDMLDCTNLSTIERFDNIRIAGVPAGDKMLHFSYDLEGVSLIGMEILKDWDIHIAKSIKTGETTLLACPLNRINQDYIDALIDEFDIGQRMINQLTAKISNQTIEANYVNDKLNIHKR